MKPKIMAMLLFLILAAPLTYASQSAAAPKNFKFEPSKMDLGTRYHYVASNIQWWNGVHTYVYVKAKDTLIIYRDYTSLSINLALLQTVKFNWNYMTAEEIKAINPLNPKKISYLSVGSTVNFTKKTVIFRQSTQSDYVVLDHYRAEPCFSYEDYHIDLQFALRFLKNPQAETSVTDYYYDQIRESQIHYLGAEKVNGVMCRKYELRRAGILAALFKSPKAYFWLARDDSRHYTVKYINYAPRDSYWKDFKLELVNQQKMTAAEWDDFVNSLIIKANLRL